jgi:hypothetical protein
MKSTVSIIITLMMEAARTSETSGYFQETTRRCVQESCHIHTRYSQNLNIMMIGII